MAWFSIEKLVKDVTKLIVTTGLIFADEQEALQIREHEMLIDAELAKLKLQNGVYAAALGLLEKGALDFEQMDKIKQSIKIT